eukprot:scaffold1373_cov367-Pinguiococcus_pyrenoidosus.AAC.3
MRASSATPSLLHAFWKELTFSASCRNLPSEVSIAGINESSQLPYLVRRSRPASPHRSMPSDRAWRKLAELTSVNAVPITSSTKDCTADSLHFHTSSVIWRRTGERGKSEQLREHIENA